MLQKFSLIFLTKIKNWKKLKSLKRIEEFDHENDQKKTSINCTNENAIKK